MGLFKKTSNADDDARAEKLTGEFVDYISKRGYAGDQFDTVVDTALFAEQQQRQNGNYPPKR
ncbi:hypothetical protein ACWD33_26175 [Streptomyces xiamenensis]